MSEFDAAAIAQDAAGRGEDALAAVLGQLAGYASACWSTLPGAGEFRSELAADAVESVLAWVRASDEGEFAAPEVFADADGSWRWRQRALNGEIVAGSLEGYQQKRHAVDMAHRVTRQAPRLGA